MSEHVTPSDFVHDLKPYPYVPEAREKQRIIDPVGVMLSREQRGREQIIAQEMVKIVREEITKCYQREGTNHYQNCKHLTKQRVAGAVRRARRGTARRRGTRGCVASRPGRHGRGAMDFYRKVPDELKEASRTGGLLSLCACGVVALTLVTEIGAFLRTEVRTKIDVDTFAGSQLRVNFNLSFPHLHCDYASVDLWDKIGRNQANVTQNIEKWQLDEDGVKRMYQGRNRRAFDIDHDVHHPPIEEMHANGVHVWHVNADEWEGLHEHHEYVFVDFYAPWCLYCQSLRSTWEALAEELEKRDLGVAVAAVDCVDNEARHHSLNTLRTNLSHTVHHLSFGVPLTDAQHRKLATIDVRHARTDTLDGEDYYHDDYHYAYQHFVHIVPTKYNLGVFWRDRFAAFQTLHSHHLLKYAEHVPPEARFSYDISPMAVVVDTVRVKWYDFLTSLLAIVGGTFALFKLANDTAARLF
ncbi:hypothetical protein JL722_3164 [Aureococcus anophagefferens]|nr:hypothetical protein JL722_3164 [Aureococcus anophagefferens]